MKEKKVKWRCPLCLGYDTPPNSNKLEMFEAMEELHRAIERIFVIMFWDNLPDDYD